MATLQVRNASYRVLFCHQGKRHSFTLGKVPKREAELVAANVDRILLRVEQRLLSVPIGTDIVEFVKGDGKPPEAPPAPLVTFGGLKEKYLAAHGNGAMEDSSLTTIKIHLKHLTQTLGDRFPIRQLTLSDVQRHIDRRRGMKYRDRPIGAVTIKKEVTTLRGVWNWGHAGGLVAGQFPLKGLTYPKTDEKPPFLTRPEIERRLPGLTGLERDELWECLFLTKPEVKELLTHVAANATLPWVFPAVALAAHTGARRSEVIRVRTHDLDVEGRTVTIREKKKTRGQRTTRRVPLSPFLVGVLAEWLSAHPGGQFLFCQAGAVDRSKKRSKTTGHRSKDRPTTLKGRLATVSGREKPEIAPVTKGEAHDHFKRTLAGSAWEVVRGWHVLRHSFISNCAAAGIDQRLIDSWVGHTTEEVRKRYLHLIPSDEQKAIGAVFG